MFVTEPGDHVNLESLFLAIQRRKEEKKKIKKKIEEGGIMLEKERIYTIISTVPRKVCQTNGNYQKKKKPKCY